ncbi:general substrate transporter [Penicillium canariense]|uniref:General substrate transporter n=1 Tax=Penicillium canariense TaxID=189055 RepID=A0A9W9LDY0_9EURO|nr:general substrate transporter [Penicillium canariense]KAJ5150347.1 general substrate transporter [Penicillium canariense]
MSAATDPKQDLGDLDEFDGFVLADVTPKLEKWWFQYPHLLKLNLLLVCAFLAQFTCGFDGSMINGMQSLPSWKAAFGNPTGAKLGTLVNAINIGVLLSALFSSQLCEILGRKKPITIGTALITIGSVLQGAAHSLGMFIAGRLIIGLGTGIVAVAAPQLMTEAAYPTHRGKIVSLYMTQWVVGYLIAAWTTFGTFKMDSSWSWRLPSLLQGVPSLLQLVISIFAPESPRWLVFKDRQEEAMNMLAKYHAGGDRNSRLIRFEMLEIQATLEEEKKKNAIQWVEFIRTKGNRKRLWILLFIGYAAQLSGLGLTGYYLSKILDSVGITDARTQLLINAIAAIWQLCCSVFFAMLIDRFGRRGSITFGMTVMLLVFIIWTICSAINEQKNFTDHPLALAVVAMIFLFQVGYQPFAIATVPYVVECSLFSLRSKTAMIFQFCGYTASFFTGYVNPIAIDSIGWRYYIVACVVLGLECAFAWWYLPETKGKGLEEIGEIFDGDELLTGVQAISKHRKEQHAAANLRERKTFVDHVEVSNNP